MSFSKLKFSGSFFPSVLLGLLLVLTTTLVYRNSFSAPFLFDDTSSIVNNVSIRRLWPIDSPVIGGTRGRPIANFSFALNYRIGGLDVAGYHGANLAIHLLAGLVLFGVIRRTLQLPIFEGRFSRSATLLGFAVAALWLIHPLQTEAVTYVVQRTESLMGLFYLLAIYGLVGALGSSAHAKKWQALAVIACFAGMACKEVMVTAPFVILLLDRTFGAGSFRAAWQQRSGFYLALASSWLALAWLMSGTGDRGVGFASGVGPWRYALTESVVVLRYFKLAFWPAPLVFDYGSVIVESLREVWPWVTGVMVALFVTLCALRLSPRIGFLLAWPFLTLAPTSSFVPVALQPMAEHRMYLPLAAIVCLAVLGLHKLAGSRTWLFVIGLVGLLGVASYERNAVYANEISLWADTVAKRPSNDRARQNLGTAYLHAGRLAEAEAELDRAVTLNSRNYEALNNLGLVYARTGRQPQARELFQTVLKAAPTFAQASYNLGCLLLEQGSIGEARDRFQDALRVNPLYGDAHINLAAILSGERKLSEAIEHYSAALLVYPADAQLYFQRAYANVGLGRLSAAIADYEKALQLRPEMTEARQNLDVLRRAAGGLPR